MDDPRVYIMDAYNRYIYPGDGFAKREYNQNSSSQCSRPTVLSNFSIYY